MLVVPYMIYETWSKAPTSLRSPHRLERFSQRIDWYFMDQVGESKNSNLKFPFSIEQVASCVRPNCETHMNTSCSPELCVAFPMELFSMSYMFKNLNEGVVETLIKIILFGVKLLINDTIVCTDSLQN